MTDVLARSARQTAQEIDGERVVAKVARRLIPILVTAFFVAYLDRVNVGFAALTMNKDLGFTPEFFGWAAGSFFIGYCLLEAPSNYILHRVGARVWMARIMVSWGLVSALTAFVWDGTSFVVLRVMLGVAEAGFSPGVILYLTYWIPAAQRARIIGAFLLALPLSSVVGAPLSGLILSGLDGVFGVAGWRWLFFIEAAPAMLLGVACYFYLPDRPSDASWLTPQERDWLLAELAREGGPVDESPWRALRDPRVLTLGVAYFGIIVALYGLGFWLPQIIKAFGVDVVAAGFLTAVPFVFGALAMVLWSRSSDRKNERVAHTVLASLVASLGLAASAYAPTPLFSMIALSVAAVGTLASMPTFWSFVTLALPGAGAVVGVAVINSIGNVSGFAAPYLVGLIKGATGEFDYALLALAAGPLMAGPLVLLIARATLLPPRA
ncbi:MFS transporter [Methylocystis sp. ATCC 49242]|uniref:MFS transporter n=1 Tax=Methylocystis sp. ATCC 49242 TaxID=622637 RepID=UPI0001F881B1|nr:MFS transporter [Methylocystis sp. ATCC 49242]